MISYPLHTPPSFLTIHMSMRRVYDSLITKEYSNTARDFPA